MSKFSPQKQKALLILLFIWLVGVIVDRVWFFFDNSVPAWDQADYLNGAMNYWNALRDPHLLSGTWWRDFWLLSNKIPPLTYILTAPFLSFFGASADSATLVLSLFSAILLGSVYSLGKLFFNSAIALFACILCQLLPGLYFYRLEFLLDYPLSAIATFSFACLSFWYFNKRQKFGWFLAALWGISLGMALMVKQTSIFFLFFPLVFVFFQSLFARRWTKLAQLIFSFLVSALIFFPWYRTNWLLIFTAGKRASIDAAIAEGDPSLNSWGAWTYYGEVLPYLLSWPLLLIPLICLIYFLIKRRTDYQKPAIIIWLSIFIVGGYLLSSVNINKDARYILPILPVLSLVIAGLIFSWQGKGKEYLRWGTIGLSLLLMCLNLFPLGGNLITQKLSPRVEHHPDGGGTWHNQDVIAETIKTSPYLRSNIGVLPSTPEINQHNISFYGFIANFQVFGRQVGVREKEVEQDVNALDWFLTKTGEQGSIPEAQKTAVQLVENSEKFELQNSWQLPDGSDLKLYRRSQPSASVLPQLNSDTEVKLTEVIIPERYPPGFPLPITYKWQGSWQQLQEGIVLLSWYREGEDTSIKWLHDHGIAMGNLHSLAVKKEQVNQPFQVVENTAMLPPANLAPGNYTLKGTYLNRNSGETHPLKVPSIRLILDENAAPLPAPELDLATQLRQIAPNLARGIDGLEPIFATINRINQYDPIQDYLPVSEKALSYRLQTEDNLDYLYTLVLAQALQQDVRGAIASLKELIKMAPNNPYNHAYLAFVYLYDWRGREAEKALQPALELAPDLEILQYLDGISALMQGNLVKAWRVYQSVA